MIFLVYEEFGNIDENAVDCLKKYNINMSKEAFDIECQNLLKRFIDKEEEYKKSIMYEKEYEKEEFIYEFCPIFFNNYRYLLGTLLAFYAQKYSKIENIVYLNNHINDLELASLDLISLLNEIGININDKEFNSKVFASIDSFINEYTDQKSR